MSAPQENTFQYIRYNHPEDIPGDVLSLLEAAIRTRRDAYAPYSNFLVGAALQLEDGRIVTGNNQENAASPSSLCAERVAVYHAGAVYPGVKILRIAISGGPRDSQENPPIAPCGACRQAILEYAQKQNSPIEIVFCGPNPVPAIHISDISDLLPFNFGKDFL